jgi:hypothetical protein
MKSYNTLSEAMSSLKKNGYGEDFNMHPEWIECPSLDLRLKPEEFHVDEVHRFEGMSDPEDNDVLFAITSTKGVRGLLTDAYGLYAESLSPEMIKKLKVDDATKYS